MSTDLLDMAEDLRSSGKDGWPQASAFLTRMALEVWIRGHSARLDASLPGASMRSQLLCLAESVEPDAAARASFVWHSLSQACHHHAYELSPTSAELGALIGEVRRLVDHSSPTADR